MKMNGLKLFIAVVVVSVSIGRKRVGAQVHHVVGGDRGWDPSSDLRSWSNDRIFRVGDKIWFAYSAAHENIVELKSQEDYISCDVNNPIKMYTDGFNKISLEEEGIRYFASGNLESCNSGLKLHVEVQPNQPRTVGSSSSSSSSNSSDAAAVAAGPTISDSTHLSGLTYMLVVGLFLSYLGL